MPRLAVAMLAHEGNSFCPVPADLAAFRDKVWLAGEAALREAYTGTASEPGAVVDFLDRRPDWRATVLRLAATTPCGPLTEEAFETIAGEIVDGLATGGWDAVYLALHGAMLAEHEPEADLELVRRVRRTIGPDVLLGASFDLHANMSPDTVALLDMGAGYKTHPHVDQHATATRVLETLRRTHAGELRPVGALAKLDAILPSIAMRTAGGPMAELEALAAEREAGGLLDVTVFGGFSYGDSLSAGASIMAFADGDRQRAEAAAAELRDAMADRRDRFFITLPGPAEAIRQALDHPARPVAVTDPGDNPLSGGIADTPGLLAALLAAPPTEPTVFAYLRDPGLVAHAREAGAGGRIAGTLGAALTRDFGAPVPFAGSVVALADVDYRGDGPMGTGVRVDFGPSALIALDAMPVRVVVTSSCANLIDEGLFAALGIDVRREGLLCVKAKNHFRAAFGPLMATIVDCDAPGPAALAIESFPFRHAPRHLYPLSTGRR